MLEALALGVPIVAPDIGTARLLTNNGKCGKIVDKNEDAANAMIGFMNADKREVSLECRNFVQRFALDTYIKKIEELFDSVIDEK